MEAVLSRTDPGQDPDPERGRSLRSRFSAWTPLSDRRRNQQVRESSRTASRDWLIWRTCANFVLQLFEDRVSLVLRWFDLWTDRQRRQLMSSLLGRCTSSQLRWALRLPPPSQNLLSAPQSGSKPPGAAGIC